MLFDRLSVIKYAQLKIAFAFLSMSLLGNLALASSVLIKQSCASVSKETCKIAHELRRGINFGNMLEAPNEGDWGIRLEPSYIDLVAGRFDTVRVPIRWSNHAAATEDAVTDEFFFRRVENIVDALLQKNLYVIINMHHYRQISGSKLDRKEFAVDESVVERRFLNMWHQISERFKNKSSKLLFELLNEPHGKMSASKWNIFAQKALDIVRKENPTRAVLIGPVYYNNVRNLPKLQLPKDENIIVSIHSYTPFFLPIKEYLIYQ